MVARCAPVESRAYVADRLVSAAKRWQSVGETLTSQQAAGGDDDALRLSRRIMATIAVIRSKRYRDIITDDFLTDISGKSASQIADLIAAQFPRNRLPGYADD